MNKILVVYYSYGGNTRKISQYVADKIGAKLVEIKTSIPYSTDYDIVVEQGRHEVNEGFMPEIMKLNIDMNDFDTVVIATPVWWYTFAPAIKSFMNSYDLSNKTIYPLATNGGWIGHTHKDFEKAAPDSTIAKTLNVRFDETTMITGKDVIDKWIQSIQ